MVFSIVVLVISICAFVYVVMVDGEIKKRDRWGI